MSPPRKFRGKVKPGMGINGTEGELFAKRGTDPWTVRPNSEADCAAGDGIHRRDNVKPGKGITDDIGVGILRNKMPDDQSGGAGNRQIWDEVEGQSSDDGNRAVKSRGND